MSNPPLSGENTYRLIRNDLMRHNSEGERLVHASYMLLYAGAQKGRKKICRAQEVIFALPCKAHILARPVPINIPPVGIRQQNNPNPWELDIPNKKETQQ